MAFLSSKCGMAPSPTIFALEDFRIYISTSYHSNVIFKVKVLIDKHLCRRFTLEIPDIDSDYSHI